MSNEKKQEYILECFAEQAIIFSKFKEKPVGVIILRQPISINIENLEHSLKITYPNLFYRQPYGNELSHRLTDLSTRKLILEFSNPIDGKFRKIESSLNPGILSALIQQLPEELNEILSSALPLAAPLDSDIIALQNLARENQELFRIKLKYEAHNTKLYSQDRPRPEESTVVPQDNNSGRYYVVNEGDNKSCIYTTGMQPCVSVLMISHDTPTKVAQIHADADTKMDVIRKMSKEFPCGAIVYVCGGDDSVSSVTTQNNILRTLDNIILSDDNFSIGGIDLGSGDFLSVFGVNVVNRTLLNGHNVDEKHKTQNPIEGPKNVATDSLLLYSQAEQAEQAEQMSCIFLDID